MCYLLNHTCCLNRRATQKGDKSLLQMQTNTNANLFAEVLLKLTPTHTPLPLKGSGEKETERKKPKNQKRIQDRSLRCMADKEIKSTHPGLQFLEIQGSVLSPSFMPGQSNGGTEHLLSQKSLQQRNCQQSYPLCQLPHAYQESKAIFCILAENLSSSCRSRHCVPCDETMHQAGSVPC